MGQRVLLEATPCRLSSSISEVHPYLKSLHSFMCYVDYYDGPQFWDVMMIWGQHSECFVSSAAVSHCNPVVHSLSLLELTCPLINSSSFPVLGQLSFKDGQFLMCALPQIGILLLTALDLPYLLLAHPPDSQADANQPTAVSCYSLTL